jgi:hypothetical protein
MAMSEKMHLNKINLARNSENDAAQEIWQEFFNNLLNLKIQKIKGMGMNDIFQVIELLGKNQVTLEIDKTGMSDGILKNFNDMANGIYLNIKENNLTGKESIGSWYEPMLRFLRDCGFSDTTIIREIENRSKQITSTKVVLPEIHKIGFNNAAHKLEPKMSKIFLNLASDKRDDFFGDGLETTQLLSWIFNGNTQELQNMDIDELILSIDDVIQSGVEFDYPKHCRENPICNALYNYEALDMGILEAARECKELTWQGAFIHLLQVIGRTNSEISTGIMNFFENETAKNKHLFNVSGIKLGIKAPFNITMH